MLATVVVVCPSGSSVSASMPMAIVMLVGAAACPPRGIATSVSATTQATSNATVGLRAHRTMPLLPLPRAVPRGRRHPDPTPAARASLVRPVGSEVLRLPERTGHAAAGGWPPRSLLRRVPGAGSVLGATSCGGKPSHDRGAEVE